jgi:DNA-binding transcriptional ArsR family regulator
MTYASTQFSWSDAEFDQLAKRLKGISHPMRLSIMCFLGDGEQSVNAIFTALGTTQPNISQHLGILTNRKLLTSRKDGNRIYYRLADTRLTTLISTLRSIYCPDA